MATLSHDSSGFLTGERLVVGIDAVKSDTDEILALMRAGMAQNKSSGEKSQQALEDIRRNTKQTREVGESSAGGERRGQSRERTITRQAAEAETRTRTAAGQARSAEERQRERDERGRFVARSRNDDGGDDEDSPKKQGMLSRLVDAMKHRMGIGGPDTENLDPTVTALHEASQLLSPVARIGGAVFKAGGWLFGKRKDDLPKDQKKHNKKTETLLGKILKSLGRHGVGNDNGLRLPIIGGFIGGMFEHFAPLITRMLGGVLPMAGRMMRGGAAALGIGAAWEGGQAIGKWIYDTFQPQIASVADAIGSTVKGAIAAYDSGVSTLSGWMETTVKGYETTVQAASDGIEWIAGKLGWLKDAGSKVADAAKDGYNWMVDKASHGMEWLGNKVGFSPAATPKNANAYNDVMQQEYAAAGFSPEEAVLLKGQVQAESGFNPLAVSSKGAFGLTQFTPETAKQYGVIPGDSPEAIRSQIRGQAKYMAYLKKRYGGDMDKALAGYNAGEGNVDKALKQAKTHGGDWRSYLPKPDETLSYIGRAKQYASQYSAGIGQPMSSDAMFSAVKTASMIGAMTIPRAPASPAANYVLRIPPAPKVQQQVGGRNTPMPVVIQSSPSEITQNVADRDLAHAITGGLGMSLLRGQ